MFFPALHLFLLTALPPGIAAIPPHPAYNSHVINVGPLLTPNISTSSSSKEPIPNIATPANDITVQCLPARYGSKIPVADCIDAVGQIMPSPEIHDWAERHAGFVKQHFPLPFMFMGRKYISSLPTTLVLPPLPLPFSLNYTWETVICPFFTQALNYE